MPTFPSRWTRLLLLPLVLAAGAVQAQEAPPERLAPGFTTRAAGSRLVVMPADMELYSISAGGVVEPRADWTEAAQKNFAAALEGERDRLGPRFTRLAPAAADELAELMTLQRAVASAISLHHQGGLMALATKGNRLEWSLGDAVRPLKERTGADYALFTWVRDTYGATSARRRCWRCPGRRDHGGREQTGHASLVDLNTGRVVWFNGIDRMFGDLRASRSPPRRP